MKNKRFSPKMSTTQLTAEDYNQINQDNEEEAPNSEPNVDIKSFFDNEAEYSGSEGSSDEEDNSNSGEEDSSSDEEDNANSGEEDSDEDEDDEEEDSDGEKGGDNEEEAPSSEPHVDIKTFFDNEAELSGSEASSDEAEDEDDEIVEKEPEEELPSDDELRNEIGRVYFKQEMDEDKRKLLQYQEHYLDDGDLHGDGKVREKKFRWKNIDNTAWRGITDSEGSESDDGDTPKPVFKLKQLNEINIEEKVNSSSSRAEVENNSCVPLKRSMFAGPSGSITSYIIRDEKLKSVLSLNRKRNSPFRSKQPQQTKRLKASRKENKESIFDIFASL